MGTSIQIFVYLNQDKISNRSNNSIRCGSKIWNEQWRRSIKSCSEAPPPCSTSPGRQLCGIFKRLMNIPPLSPSLCRKTHQAAEVCAQLWGSVCVCVCLPAVAWECVRVCWIEIVWVRGLVCVCSCMSVNLTLCQQRKSIVSLEHAHIPGIPSQ